MKLLPDPIDMPIVLREGPNPIARGAEVLAALPGQMRVGDQVILSRCGYPVMRFVAEPPYPSTDDRVIIPVSDGTGRCGVWSLPVDEVTIIVR